MAFPTREAIATTRVNDVLYSDQVFLNVGEQLDIRFEGDSTTSDRYATPADASTPSAEDIGLFHSSMGQLLDAFFYSTLPGMELKYYEAIDIIGSGGWRLVDQWLLTPGVVFKLTGYRVQTSYGKLSLVNTGASLVIGEFQVRLSSL
jgi:hypothetical protein